MIDSGNEHDNVRFEEGVGNNELRSSECVL